MNLDDILGNTSIKKVLSSYTFEKPILYEGELGCGKTELAIITAKLFGAEGEATKDINCVYFSKVDDMRSEIDELSKTTLFGKKKVLILDELHELSDKAQQVLLKPLQSLPKDVFVIGCTTTVEKLYSTLLSRFTRLRVMPLSSEDSLLLINRVCKKRDFDLSKPMKALLLEKCGGIPRNLIIGTEKLRGIVDLEEASFLLDITDLEDSKDVLELLKCLLSKASWDKLIPVINKVLKTASPNAVRVGLINLIGGRLLSKFPKEPYLPKLVKILHKAEGYPEKALLVSALFEAWQVVNGA